MLTSCKKLRNRLKIIVRRQKRRILLKKQIKYFGFNTHTHTHRAKMLCTFITNPPFVSFQPQCVRFASKFYCSFNPIWLHFYLTFFFSRSWCFFSRILRCKSIYFVNWIRHCSSGRPERKAYHQKVSLLFWDAYECISTKLEYVLNFYSSVLTFWSIVVNLKPLQKLNEHERMKFRILANDNENEATHFAHAFTFTQRWYSISWWHDSCHSHRKDLNETRGNIQQIDKRQMNDNIWFIF